MNVIYSRCCGLDVHKQTIVACLITPKGKEIRTFGTMTESLLELADWLAANNCTAVAMESTGVYWKPIYNILEATGMEILVVNAQHIKNVPGRKTDEKIPNGLLIFCNTVSFVGAISRIEANGNYASWSVIGPK